MTNYVIEWSGSGEVMENCCDTDVAAECWVEDTLDQRGYDPADSVSGDWDADGTTDDGEQRWRKLYWASEEDALNDAGANAICQLCRVGDEE